MTRIIHRRVIVIVCDLLLALFIFSFTENLLGLKSSIWEIYSALLWVALGILFGKLRFDLYKRTVYALLGIFIAGILSGALLAVMYSKLMGDYKFSFLILLPVVKLVILELALFELFYFFVYRKIPFFYEAQDLASAERASDKVAQDSGRSKDVEGVIKAITNSDLDAMNAVFGNLSPESRIYTLSDPRKLHSYNDGRPSFIIHNRSLNKIRYINTLLENSNALLTEDGYIMCRCTTAAIRRRIIKAETPNKIGDFICSVDYVIHRVVPKIPYLKHIYYGMTRGVRKVLTRVEILGRLYRAGYEVVCEKIIADQLYVVARRVKESIIDDKPSKGVLIRLKRRGKDGKFIGVYKFRTMYSYSEYLQPYIYETEGLADGGKFLDDYRVTPLGKFMRKTWIDELPMFLNLINGDMKFVGVRPLSNHYFGLYTKELQELRMKVKPGLLPPFYADMPKTLDDIQASEERYIRKYIKSPLRTDWLYFWRTMNNIVIKGKRSK